MLVVRSDRFGKAIQQARMEKGLSQKDCAQKINEKPSVLQDYESGKAIPNTQILAKLERTLGVKLRGKLTLLWSCPIAHSNCQVLISERSLRDRASRSPPLPSRHHCSRSLLTDNLTH